MSELKDGGPFHFTFGLKIKIKECYHTQKDSRHLWFRSTVIMGAFV